MDLQAFSSLLNPVIGLLVGAVGLYLYRKQKSDTKQNAAVVILTEIRNAEAAIQAVRDFLRDTGTVPEITVLPFNSWNKYSNLFAMDFDQDEMDLVNEFYADAEKVSSNVTQANNMFLVQVEKRTNAIQQTNVRIIERASSADEAKERLAAFEEKLWAENMSSTAYIPKGFYDKLFKYLPEIQFILPTTVGSKLKRLANMS